MKLPVYHRDVDFEALFADHPPPDDYATGMYLWGRARIEQHQDRLFRKVLETAWQNDFYRTTWRAAGLEPGDVTGLADIEKLPVVSVYDFKDAIDAHPPFGAHQGVDGVLGTKPLKIQSSGGTTGKPRPTFFGPTEWEVQGLQTARALYLQGARPGDVMHIPVTLSTANLGWCYYQACFYYLGIVPITTGSGVVTSSRHQVERLVDWGATVLGAFPEYLLHLAEVARGELGIDVADGPVRLISTYLGPDLDGALRADLERAWGATVFDNYGTHEIGVASFECQRRQGLHFNEDTIYVEVADPDTGATATTGTGNLVATALHRSHPPLIRYNLMDLIELMPPETCSCGSSTRRMGRFLGRSDDMVKYKGTNLYPMACLTAVKSVTGTTGEWLCVLTREGHNDRLVVQVEVEVAALADDRVKHDLERGLRQDLGVRVDVELVAPHALDDLTNFGREGKSRRLLDRRADFVRAQ